MEVTELGDREFVIEGQQLTLECRVQGAEILSGTNSYIWTKGISSLELETSMAYTFNPTGGDDEQRFYCRGTVNSDLLRNPIYRNGFRIIRVLG